MADVFTALPVYRIAAFAFALNTCWEFVQCVFFYDMWDWPFWRATAFMWGAILGDVALVLGFAYVAYFLSKRRFPPATVVYPALAALGFCVAVALEWTALAFNLWAYAPDMPGFQIAGETIGFVPVLQMAILPGLSIFLAARRRT